jgi:Fe-S-cluster containining protein
MQFPCVSCGICCKHLDPVLYADIRKPDGACMHYDDETKRCSIYDSRPLECRINDFYDHYLVHEVEKKQYYAENIQACKNLMLLDEDYESYYKLVAKAAQIEFQEEE